MPSARSASLDAAPAAARASLGVARFARRHRALDDELVLVVVALLELVEEVGGVHRTHSVRAAIVGAGIVGTCRARSSPGSPDRTASTSPSSCKSKGYDVFGLVAGQANPRLDDMVEQLPVHRAALRRPARPAVADRRRRAGAAGRGLQPRRDLVRRAVVQAAGAHGGGHRPRRPADARGDPGRRRHAEQPDPLLSGVVERDVRQGARGAAERGDAVPSAQPVRRREGVRPQHHGQLPRGVRHSTRAAGSCSTTKSERRGPEFVTRKISKARRAHQARPPGEARARHPRDATRLGIRAGVRRGDVADAAAARAGRLRHRDGRDAHRPGVPRARVRARRASRTGSGSSSPIRACCVRPRSTT